MNEIIKLAKLWRIADAIDSTDDQEAMRLLEQFQSEEDLDEEPQIPIPPVPTKPTVIPSIEPTIIPPKITPDPKIRKHREHKKEAWNLDIELHPPVMDGSWPQVSETPPPGFPFSADSLKDGKSIRALFQKPETWTALQEMAANPSKRDLIQSYLLPKIVLAVGKAWWNINKRRKSLGNAPFGLFSSEEYKKYIDVDLDKTDAGRAFIATINWNVAKILQFFLATGAPAGSRIDGYIYNSLKRRMMTIAGKMQGFELNTNLTCAYCLEKQVIKKTPIILQESAKSKRKLYTCPTCADLIDTKEQELESKEQGTINAEETLNNIVERIRDGYAILAKTPNDHNIKLDIQNLSNIRDSFMQQIPILTKERDELRKDIANRRRMINIPRSHIACINENCPSQKIPLTFIDWEDGFWKTPESTEARKRLANTYGIVEKPEGQKVEDKSTEVSETAGTYPPEWLWDVPFQCPFDGARFTPRKAFGHGKFDPKGKRMGGLFISPPYTTKWDKLKPLEEKTEEDESGEEYSREVGAKTTSSPDTLHDQEVKLENEQLASLLRQELYHQKEKRAVAEGKHPRTTRLFDTLYDTFIEVSYVNPLSLVEYFTSRKTIKIEPSTTSKGDIKDSIAVLPPGVAEQIESPLVQVWFSKILEQKDGMALLQKSDKATEEGGGYLVNQLVDRVWPDGFFLAQVKMGNDGQLEAYCEVKSTSNQRGKGYKDFPYMALVLGIWDSPGKPTDEQRKISISRAKGAKLISGMTSRMDEMEEHNARKIRFSSNTKLNEGDTVIVQALMMPWNPAWRALRDIKDLRKGSETYMRDSQNTLAILRRYRQPEESDEPALLALKERFKKLKLPEKLLVMNKASIQRLKRKEKLNDFEQNLLERLEQVVEQQESKMKKASLVLEAKDPLSEYKSKRKFDETSEPEGKTEDKNKHRFVIQLHHAKKARDHFDLRLENDKGALSSWAIPKHHLPKGKEKLLAVKTEDHPTEYLKFKGEISSGYGAGTVEIYDSGTYEEIERTNTKITFRLKGKKEKGTYRLFRAGEGKKWLIMEGIGEKKASDAPPFSKRAGHFTFSPRSPSHKPRQWVDYKLPSGVGTSLTPKSEEDLWKEQERFRKEREERAHSVGKPELPLTKETPKGLEGLEKKWVLLTALGFNFGWYSNHEKANIAREALIRNFAMSRRFSSPVRNAFTEMIRDFLLDYGYGGNVGSQEEQRMYDFLDGKQKDMVDARLHVGSKILLTVSAYGPKNWKPFDSSKIDSLDNINKHPLVRVETNDLPSDVFDFNLNYMIEVVKKDGEQMLNTVIDWMSKGGDIFHSITAMTTTLPISKRAGHFTFSPYLPSHKPRQWVDYKLPSGVGTSLIPKSEEDLWKEQERLQKKREEQTVKKTRKVEPEVFKLTTKKAPNQWFLLHMGGYAIGWYKNPKNAYAARNRIIDDFESSREGPLGNMLYRKYLTTDAGKMNQLTYLLHSQTQNMRDLRDLIGQELVDVGVTNIDPNWNPDPSTIVDEKELPDDEYHYIDARIREHGHLSSAFSGKNKIRKIITNILRWIDGDIIDPYDILKVAGENMPFSKRAKLDQLPIAHDPAMWTNEQLFEVIHRPELFENNKEKYQKAIEQAIKRGLIKKPEPRDIGKWREYGYWLLMWGGIPLAFFDNDAKVNMARRLLIEDFAKNGNPPELVMKNDPMSGNLAYLLDSIVIDNMVLNDPTDSTISGLDRGDLFDQSEARSNKEKKEIAELLHHPFHSKLRKQFAEKALNVYKAPNNFTPSKESISTGQRPTEENGNKASDDITGNYSETKPGFADALVDSYEKTSDAKEDFVAESAKKLSKRFLAEEAGLDPEKLADDLPFSARNYQ